MRPSEHGKINMRLLWLCEKKQKCHFVSFADEKIQEGQKEEERYQ